ncbi:hypothetical protein BV898_19343 [Hypsibius exemplaris]|uniref:Uncharacterized protein n=1 Tax=Hypsibius exemplaris TaxID=2072580 RepID=A0A9X6NQJ2_HYPEX|nr:hypothetical protein BV898_19343 [Hypsibius exemplaris]
MWPFLLVINELPKETRYLIQNMVTYAIWEGRKGETQDVPFDSVLEHLVEDLEKINNPGVTLRLNGKLERVKFFVSRIVADMPAKAEMLNMVHHNGFYGCGICEYAGFSATRKNGHMHSYAPQAGVPPGQRRTHKRMVKQSQQQSGSKEATGMKDTPRVLRFYAFNISTGLLIDDLHAVYEGVVKKIIKLWMKRDGEKPCRLTEEQFQAEGVESARLQKFSSHRVFTVLCRHRERRILETLGTTRREHLHFIQIENQSAGRSSTLTNFYDAFVKNIPCYTVIMPTESTHTLLSIWQNTQCHGTNVVRKTLLRQLLSYQTLQRKVQQLTDPSERRYVARLRRQRIGLPTEGFGWKAFGRPSLVKYGFPEGPYQGCAEHVTVTFKRLEIEKLIIWSADYLRAKKSSYECFFVTHKDSSFELIVKVDDSIVEDDPTGFVTLKKHNKLKRKFEEVSEAQEALAEELAGLRKSFDESVMTKVATMISDALLKQQNSFNEQIKASINKLMPEGLHQSAVTGFTTQGLPEDSVEKLTEKYLAAGIRTWRDAAGKFLTDMFPLEVLAKSCPTAEGVKQSKDDDGQPKPPLDRIRIKHLREFIVYFVGKNTSNKEDIPAKGKVTDRIHCATKQARKDLKALKDQQQ